MNEKSDCEIYYLAHYKQQLLSKSAISSVKLVLTKVSPPTVETVVRITWSLAYEIIYLVAVYASWEANDTTSVAEIDKAQYNRMECAQKWYQSAIHCLHGGCLSRSQHGRCLYNVDGLWATITHRCSNLPLRWRWQRYPRPAQVLTQICGAYEVCSCSAFWTVLQVVIRDPSTAGEKASDSWRKQLHEIPRSRSSMSELT
jgi:hypothetical protein